MNAIAAAVRDSIDRGTVRSAPVQELPAAARERSFDLALAVARALSAGDYARGWELMERNPSTRMTGLPVPRWNGQSFRGVMAVVPDDGLGDQIMLARFIRHIKARGAGPVVALAPKPLARLFARVQGVDDVVPIDRVPGGHANINLPWRPDWYVNVASLPRIFQVRVDSIPAEPYINADPADIERWRPRVPQQGLRVGLVWRGDPNNAKDAWRSLPGLATLAPLFEVPGVAFVSLQKGAGEEEAAAAAAFASRMPAPPFVHLGSGIRDFADSAAVLAQLDLLVTVDTSTANLAGAMGVPTWVLTQHEPEFRWVHGWYTSARLFRQHRPGDWSGPVADVARTLKAYAQDIHRV